MQELLNIKTILVHVIAPATNCIALVYLWFKLFNIKNKKLGIYTLIPFSILTLVNTAFTPQKYKIIIYSLICFIIIRVFIVKESDKAIIATIITQATAMLSEMITVLGISFFLNSNEMVTFLQTNKGIIFINIVVSIIMFLLAFTNITTILYKILNKITNEIKKKRLILYTIILVVAANALTHITYHKFNINILLTTNTILIITYAIITYHTVKTDNKFQGITDKYNLSLDALRENEKLLDDYKMYSHENNNTLKTIRNMIETNDKELLNYVNTVINDKEKYDEAIIHETSIIPISGLKAIVYSKIKDMKKDDIKSELYVDKNIKSADLITIDDETLLDICKITGVFLDNAIEATRNQDNKHINISLYKDNNSVIIEIANTFSEKIDFKNISKKGYTTKRGKHGYGLSLVKTIIEHNKKLENTIQINNSIFIQTLKVKL